VSIVAARAFGGVAGNGHEVRRGRCKCGHRPEPHATPAAFDLCELEAGVDNRSVVAILSHDRGGGPSSACPLPRISIRFTFIAGV